MNAVPVSLMRTRIEIQSRSMAADTYGGPNPTWSTAATRWGQITPLSGRELWQAQQVRPDVTHRIVLRYYAGLTPRHRLLVGSRVFNISSVLDIENRQRLHECVCVEEVT